MFSVRLVFKSHEVIYCTVIGRGMFTLRRPVGTFQLIFAPEPPGGFIWPHKASKESSSHESGLFTVRGQRGDTSHKPNSINYSAFDIMYRITSLTRIQWEKQEEEERSEKRRKKHS